MTMYFWLVTLVFFFQIQSTVTEAAEVHVAVAANFLAPLKAIALLFERESGHTVIISSGSSGKLYAQIRHGAPFDIFFSADVSRPQLLEKEGLVVPASRFTYALGRLSLWSHDPKLIGQNGAATLSDGHFDHLAIANPKTAPYGAAAKQVLERLRLWGGVQPRLVQGENIGQTFHFVFSRNADLGFVAMAQVLDPKIQGTGSRWDVPPDLHDPLPQQAVLLVSARVNVAAQTFLNYVKGPAGRRIVERFGYGLGP